MKFNMVWTRDWSVPLLCATRCTKIRLSHEMQCNESTIVDVQQIDRIVEVVKETLKGHIARLLQPKKIKWQIIDRCTIRFTKDTKKSNNWNYCHKYRLLKSMYYCETKHSRGNLWSYPPDEIVARTQQAFSEGVIHHIFIYSWAFGRKIDLTR